MQTHACGQQHGNSHIAHGPRSTCADASRGEGRRVGRALGVESGRKGGQMPMPLPPRTGSAGRRRAPAHPDLAPSAVLARYRPRSAVQQCRRNDRGARQSAANWSPFRRGCLELTQVIFMLGMSIRRGTDVGVNARWTHDAKNFTKAKESGRGRSSPPFLVLGSNQHKNTHSKV